jgi:hypothetical protein
MIEREFPSDAEIEAAATQFRSALDGIDRALWEHIHINNFPRGACGHCAELLARYLHDRFGVIPDYVSHNLDRGDGALEDGHAWLELNGFLIDISGDQFGWPAVIVTRTPGPAHSKSRLNTRYPWHLDPQWWSGQCSAIWHAAQEHLPDASSI